MRVAFLGFGLIGGSIARALHAAEAAASAVGSGWRGDELAGSGWSVAAWTPSGRGPREARRDGVIEAAPATAAAALAGADLVILAAPPLDCLELLDELAGPLAPALRAGATITDVASTKERILARADRHGLRFVGGHPMAGLEASGYGASLGDLFRDRPWVIVPSAGATPDDVARVEALAAACQARPLRMGAASHDAAAAAISHLPLVAAAALVEAVAGAPGEARRDDWADARALAASGWRDATRLALGDPSMGAGIAATNAVALAARVRALRDRLDAWLAVLEAEGGTPDPEVLRTWFAADRARLEGRE